MLPPQAHAIRILLVDDHEIVRDGIAAVLGREPDLSVVADCGSAEEAVSEFGRCRPDVTVMDMRLPGKTGADAIASIRSHDHHARFVVLSNGDGDQEVYRAFRAGAQAYVVKDMSFDRLLEAIRTVHAGLRYIPERIARRMAERVGTDDLSSRELEVLRLIADGRSNRDIASALSISEPTVKGHIAHILGKLRVTDRTQAVVAALRRGFVYLDSNPAIAPRQAEGRSLRAASPTRTG